jgi:hypothetical protein
MLVRVCFLLFLLSFSSQQKTVVRHVFAVRIGLTADSKMVQFAGFVLNDNRISSFQDLSKDDLIRYASGFWPSKFNPKREDLFLKNKIVGGIFTDSITSKKIPYCPSLDSLWKICYSDYPFKGGRERGWSQELYKPSRKQFIFLDSLYGMKDMSQHFFKDTMFWHLLRDVNDPDWKYKYQTVN